MSIEDRIAAVVAGHAYETWHTLDMDAWSVEVAAAVVAELGLQPEWAIRCGKNVARIGITEENAKAKAAMYPDSFEAVSRTATEWEKAE